FGLPRRCVREVSTTIGPRSTSALTPFALPRERQPTLKHRGRSADTWTGGPGGSDQGVDRRRRADRPRVVGQRDRIRPLPRDRRVGGGGAERQRPPGVGGPPRRAGPPTWPCSTFGCPAAARARRPRSPG